MSTTRHRIVARFILDEVGKPHFTNPKAHSHYKISLHIEDLPSDAYAVTYYLHESYYDPVREIRDKASSFAFNTTSYGDYEVTAKVRTKEGALTTKRTLYEALKETYGDSASDEIRKALQDIREN